MKLAKRHVHFEAGLLHGSTFLKHIIFRLFTVRFHIGNSPKVSEWEDWKGSKGDLPGEGGIRGDQGGEWERSR